MGKHHSNLIPLIAEIYLSSTGLQENKYFTVIQNEHVANEALQFEHTQKGKYFSRKCCRFSLDTGSVEKKAVTVPSERD